MKIELLAICTFSLKNAERMLVTTLHVAPAFSFSSEIFHHKRRYDCIIVVYDIDVYRQATTIIVDKSYSLHKMI